MYILDIDECLTESCHQNTTCNNTVGSYICLCDLGFTSDGIKCTGGYNVFWEQSVKNNYIFNNI